MQPFALKKSRSVFTLFVSTLPSRFRGESGDVLTRARDLGDPLLNDLKAHELCGGAAGFVAAPQIDVPAAAGATEMTR